MPIRKSLIFFNLISVTLLLFSFTLSINAADASVDEARTLLTQLADLSKKQAIQTEAAQKLLTGEMLKLKIPTFGELTETPDKVLLLQQNKAVGRFQLYGENNQITDVYFYLRYNDGWKVSEVRLLALTGIIGRIYLGLKDKPNLTQEEKRLLANTKLTLAPDKELTIWFSENKGILNKLATVLKAKTGDKILYIRQDDTVFPEATELLQKLNLSSASIEKNGDIQFIIGGITDNTVGFAYTPSKTPPQISPSSYIWVEEVGANWHLFRTT